MKNSTQGLDFSMPPQACLPVHETSEPRAMCSATPRAYTRLPRSVGRSPLPHGGDRTSPSLQEPPPSHRCIPRPSHVHSAAFPGCTGGLACFPGLSSSAAHCSVIRCLMLQKCPAFLQDGICNSVPLCRGFLTTEGERKLLLLSLLPSTFSGLLS